ncbi:MAG: diguanylate cyclase [Cyanobacteria bacterium P01_D01_bin.156]
MISKVEQLPVYFLLDLQRICQAFITRRWERSESRTSLIVVGFTTAYILLELFPSLQNGSYVAVGKELYWLCLLTFSLYLALRQALHNHFHSGTRHTNVQNIELEQANQQLRQNLQEQVFIEKYLTRENEELYKLATIDELTQVKNRRFLEQQIQKEWQKLQQDDYSLSVILFDVDYFKRYNDYYGHLSGDECLQKIAQVAQETLQGSANFIARYGGEEFAIVLPATSELEATELAKKLQQAIKALAIPHAQSDVSSIVSVSLGIASIVPNDTNTWTMLIDRADQALYEAKHQGRDRYTCF